MSETTPTDYPFGDWCVLELFGHTTLVGRYTEVERFGTKMLAIEPLFNGTLLSVVFHGGAAIYRLTPCSADVAYKRQPTKVYQLPPAIAAIVPPELLPAPPVQSKVLADEHDDEAADEADDEFDPDENLAMNEDPGM